MRLRDKILLGVAVAMIGLCIANLFIRQPFVTMIGQAFSIALMYYAFYQEFKSCKKWQDEYIKANQKLSVAYRLLHDEEYRYHDAGCKRLEYKFGMMIVKIFEDEEKRKTMNDLREEIFNELP